MLGSESEQRQEAADDFKAALNVIMEKKKKVRRQSQFNSTLVDRGPFFTIIQRLVRNKHFDWTRNIP